MKFPRIEIFDIYFNMSDIKANIDPGAQQPKDWSLVHRVEKTELHKEKASPDEAAIKDPESLLFAAFAAFVRKVFTFLANAGNKGTASFAGALSDLGQYLSALKKGFKRLTEEDLSFDPAYIEQLSKAWLSLLEAFSSLELMERRKKEEIRHVKLFLNAIGSFPPKEEHSIGFYLTEFADRKWLPFPFVDLLHSLYEEHQSSPAESHLNLWTLEIDKLIDLLTSHQRS